MSMDIITCDKKHPWPPSEDTTIADYLRELAERVERGEVRHISLSVHPN